VTGIIAAALTGKVFGPRIMNGVGLRNIDLQISQGTSMKKLWILQTNKQSKKGDVDVDKVQVVR